MANELTHIYPAWLGAKADLMRSMGEVSGSFSNWDKACKIIDEWFKRHLFEFGSEYRAPEHIVKSEGERFMEHVDKNSIHAIADEIYKKGLFFRQTHRDRGPFGDDTIFQYRVLVCGAPTIVGPASRTNTAPSLEAK